MELVISGFQQIFTFQYIFVILVSLLLGIGVGALPGLGPLLAIVLLIPFTIAFGPTSGILSLLAVYVGGTYGGSITAISLGIPGTPIAAATLFDGQPMAQNGNLDRALGLALAASVFGGVLSSIVLMFSAPYLARAALKFGPPEYFTLGVLGLTTIASVSRGAFTKGLISACFGALVATVGTEPATGIGRFTFGSPGLARGIDLVAMLVGLFAVSEVLVQAERQFTVTAARASVRLPSFRELGQRLLTYLRASLIGTGIGAIPGIGEVIASLVAYSVERDTSSHPETFGKGEPRGVIATEAANNACVGGALIPTLALAIPGSPISAVLMGALILLGVSPGPKLFIGNQEFLGALFAGLLMANILLLPVGRLTATLFVRLSSLKREFLIPTILLLSFIGTFALYGQLFDVWTMWVFGVAGYLLRKTGFPLAPVVIGRVLGPILEPNLQRSMALSDNGLLIFVTRPISLTIVVITIVLVVLLPLINRKGERVATGE